MSNKQFYFFFVLPKHIHITHRPLNASTSFQPHGTAECVRMCAYRTKIRGNLVFDFLVTTMSATMPHTMLIRAYVCFVNSEIVNRLSLFLHSIRIFILSTNPLWCSRDK